MNTFFNKNIYQVTESQYNQWAEQKMLSGDEFGGVDGGYHHAGDWLIVTRSIYSLNVFIHTVYPTLSGAHECVLDLLGRDWECGNLGTYEYEIWQVVRDVRGNRVYYFDDDGLYDVTDTTPNGVRIWRPVEC